MRHFLRKVREEIFKYKAYGRIRRFRNRTGKTCLLGRRRRAALWACAGGIVCMLLTGCAAPASTVPESSEEQSRVSLRNDGAEAKLVLVELETSQARTDALREIADKYEADFPKTEDVYKRQKYPRVIEYVDELPKTIGGKIKRAEIRKADES